MVDQALILLAANSGVFATLANRPVSGGLGIIGHELHPLPERPGLARIPGFADIPRSHETVLPLWS